MFMLNEKEIKDWITEFLDGTDRFVVDVKVKVGDLILVFLDSDTSLTIDHCVEVSKMIENRLDREEEDFELRVSSSGLDHPFTMKRQYVKNIGRSIEVELNDGNIHRGKLLEVLDESVTIEIILEKKRNKIKQLQTGGPMTIAFSDILEAKPVVSFH
jgi:ribosome maturation factor RimP